MKPVPKTTPSLLALSFLAGLVGTAASHDWYSGLIAEDGSLCCNSRDCHPVEYRNTETGGLEIEIGGVWIPVRPKSVLQTTSPDASAHACYYHGSTVGIIASGKAPGCGPCAAEYPPCWPETSPVRPARVPHLEPW